MYYTVDIVHFALATPQHIQNCALLMVVRLNDYLAYGKLDDLSACMHEYHYLWRNGADIDMPKEVLAAAAIEGWYEL
jgi:hypothetical protein